jgi:sugar/nucleoside kinase (ribokinase family)
MQPIKLVLVFTRLCRNLFYPEQPAGTKSDPVDSQHGGGGVTTAPILARLMNAVVALMGRCTASDAALKPLMQASGVRWLMERVPGAGAVNAVVSTTEGQRILRVCPAPTFMPPSAREIELLRRCPSGSTAMIITGSHDHELLRFILATAVERHLPVLCNPAATSLDVISEGGPIALLQVSAQEFKGWRGSSERLARHLIDDTPADDVVVTCGEEGSWGISKIDKTLRHEPALPIPPGRHLRDAGAGDAYMAGLASAYMMAPKEIRLARGMAAGSICSSMHIMGLGPVDMSWTAVQNHEHHYRPVGRGVVSAA